MPGYSLKITQIYIFTIYSFDGCHSPAFRFVIHLVSLSLARSFDLSVSLSHVLYTDTNY